MVQAPAFLPPAEKADPIRNSRSIANSARSRFRRRVICAGMLRAKQQFRLQFRCQRQASVHEHEHRAFLFRRAGLQLDLCARRAGTRRHRQHDGHLQFCSRRIRAAWRIYRLYVPEQRPACLGRHGRGAVLCGSRRTVPGTHRDSPFLRNPDRGDAGHVCHWTGVARDRALAAERTVLFRHRAPGGFVLVRRNFHFALAHSENVAQQDQQ